MAMDSSAPNSTRKIFIQRDYSFGTGVRFSTELPRELMGKVSFVAVFSYLHIYILGKHNPWYSVLIHPFVAD